MGQNSKVPWTDASHSFWVGCTKVSSGCARCYAERLLARSGRPFRVVIRVKDFKAPLRWHAPLRIFACPLSDFMHPAADLWRPDAWDVIRATPHHTWLILTKRPDRLTPERLPLDWTSGAFRHVWLGVSVETQREVERIDVLNTVPATVRFVSAEPLLGPLNLRAYLHPERVSWLIAGGESGPDHRPMDMAWAVDLYRQAEQAGIPFFFKQQAGDRPGHKPFLDLPDGSQVTVQALPAADKWGDPFALPRQLDLFAGQG